MIASLSNDRVKKNVRKGVQFIHAKHVEIFSAMAQIYQDAKMAHNIVGPILVIVAEDETKVKGKVK